MAIRLQPQTQGEAVLSTRTYDSFDKGTVNDRTSATTQNPIYVFTCAQNPIYKWTAINMYSVYKKLYLQNLFQIKKVFHMSKK